MFRIHWVSDNLIWHTSHSVNKEQAAMQASLRLAQSDGYQAVRVVTQNAAVVFSA